jgi:1-deoxy-D-xylulose-5-phosphate synthase
MVNDAIAAHQRLQSLNIKATVVNCRFVKPLDEHLIISLAQRIPNIITVEEGVVQGGFGSAILELLNDHQIFTNRVQRIGLPDKFIEHGTPDILRAKYGLNAEGISRASLDMLKAGQSHPVCATIKHHA